MIDEFEEARLNDSLRQPHNQSTMKILVTGGAGLIGSNTVGRFFREGHEIYVVDNLWRGCMDNLNRHSREGEKAYKRFYQYDLTDYSKCLEVSANMDAIIHLADVVAGISFVFENQLFVYQKNILINTNILSAAIKCGVGKFVYVGTACSYPEALQKEIGGALLKEEDVIPADPESSYGWSKLMGEYECELANNGGLIEAGILRLHNVYGPPCETSSNRSQVIPALCRKAIRFPEEDFIVWGSGSQRRAFVYVDDVVDALVAMLDRGLGVGAVQIGPTKSCSISEIAEKIIQLSDKPITPKYDVTKPEGDKDRAADVSKAERILNWSPKVGLDEGLKRTYSWIESELTK